ncbi:hypothetical protein GOV06_04940, partial [Candidatus Woesearchaeota archaeon]|nr:hypothetical protein [Candidatus Woesearchaeota archaeon]
ETEFKYRDIYFGFDPFSGEEIVWQNGKVIWSMNYYGGTILEIIPTKQVYEFLKKVLQQVTEERPFRGPTNFKEDDFEYIDKSEGDIDNFTGTEKIFYKGKEVYRLNYHGGLIKTK